MTSFSFGSCLFPTQHTALVESAYVYLTANGSASRDEIVSFWADCGLSPAGVRREAARDSWTWDVGAGEADVEDVDRAIIEAVAKALVNID